MGRDEQGRTAARRATELLDLLSPSQRRLLCQRWDTPERLHWEYTPGPRPGLGLVDMDEAQRAAALALLRTGLSDRGYAEALRVIELESVLRDKEAREGRPGFERRDPRYFWFAVFGEPGREPWGWRIGGHHLLVQATLAGSSSAGLPLFMGANPSVSPDGSRTLAEAEDLGRDLVLSLDDAQRRRTVLSDDPPRDILTGNAVRAELAAVPTGIGYDELGPAQQARLAALLDWYVGRPDPRAPAPVERATFAWLGATEPGAGHYYALRAGTVFVELDNTQNDANHVHTVVRDVERDWGEDLLVRHYAGHSG